ncbi:hypothetical protein BH11ARM1_BH11ARM1_08920 [soil metagenome]
MCNGRVEVLQGINDDPFQYCPHCGMDVRRVISRATIKMAGSIPEDKASKKGYVTYRRAEKGVWEKTAGEGPDMMVGTKADMEAVEAEKQQAAKVYDLDKTD